MVKKIEKTEIPEKQGRRYQMPFYEKYLLTVDEAAVYFHIGASKMMRIIETNPKAKWWLMNGNRKMIKQEMFAMWLDQQMKSDNYIVW